MGDSPELIYGQVQVDCCYFEEVLIHTPMGVWIRTYWHPHGGADKNWGGIIVIVRDSCIVTVRDVKRDIVTLSLKWPVAILEASKSCWQVQRTWKRRNANFLDWWKSHGFKKSDNSWKLKLNFTFWHENTKVQKYENHLTRNYKFESFTFCPIGWDRPNLQRRWSHRVSEKQN